MVERECSCMEAARGYQHVRKYYNLMRTQMGTLLPYQRITALSVCNWWYYIALQPFSNIYHLIYVENVGHVSASLTE